MQHKHPTQPEEYDGHRQTVPKQITYEQPLNERIRTLLRLEFLFAQANAHTSRHDNWDNRAAINCLLDIISTFSRSDLKIDVMKELERQTIFLGKLAQNPQVDSRRLETVLDEMDILIDHLHGLKSQHMDIRNNEFLCNIRQRSHVAGGSCNFDLPAYHFWLSQPEEKRIMDMQGWMAPFEPIKQAVNLVLRLIRDSAQTTNEIAEAGFFQKSFDQNSICQMVQVTLTDDTPCFAEISGGGKHRFSIRFLQTAFNERATQVDQNIPFKLTCCML